MGLGGMGLDFRILHRAQFPLFFQDGIGNAYLAVIMQQGGYADHLLKILAQSQLPAYTQGVFGNLFRMACGKIVPSVDAGCKHLDDGLELLLPALYQPGILDAHSDDRGYSPQHIQVAA